VAVENTLLGLLKHQPRHGYDLAREFDDGTALAEVLHLEPSMLYAYLKKLEAADFIVAQVEANDPRPPRKVFALTSAGEQVLHAWLNEPVTRTRDLRLEFLLKLYIARLLDHDAAARLVVRQRDVCQTLVANLRTQAMDETDDFRRLVMEMRLAQNEALLGWLNAAREQVAV
jgi:PadR family transcriptional regulator AphA